MADDSKKRGTTPFEITVQGKADAKQVCELVPVKDASAVPGFVNGTWFAIVAGEAPCANMSVQLVPLIYISKPDYWGIEVIGCRGDICLTAVQPYSVWGKISNTIGHKGIEIIGANRTIKIDIP